MLHAVAHQDFFKGKTKNPNIKTHTHFFKYFFIQSDFFRYRQLISAIDLSPTGQARQQLINAALSTQRNQIVLVE